jgi:branched-chain amino acid transport system permease protein
LIVTFVVIVIGGIGSIRGALAASILVGLIDTVGRAYLPDILRLFLSGPVASTAAPSIAAMLVYILMALVLALKPEGLFPARGS